MQHYIHTIATCMHSDAHVDPAAAENTHSNPIRILNKSIQYL